MSATRSLRSVVVRLEGWFPNAARPLPWRTNLHDLNRQRNPWHALIAESMLQQTQVARVLDYFPRFIARFPTPASLAAAPESDVLALWAGLGYYRRARHLHAAARAIVDRHGGHTPTDLDSLLALPGVGRYTAGAVASIALGLPAPIVDGNVLRVLLRLHGRGTDPAAPATICWAWREAESLVLAAKRPSVLNEALMELGATICTRGSSPACDRCPLARFCAARAAGRQSRIPRPKRAPVRRTLHHACLIVRDRAGRILLHQRPAGGLWAGLWQPPSLEREHPIPPAELAAWSCSFTSGSPPLHAGHFRAALTHRTIEVTVLHAAANTCNAKRTSGRWVAPHDLPSLGISNLHHRVLAMAAVAAPAPV